jgi:hypothetical protein
VLSSLPRLPNSPLAKCSCKRHALDLYGDNTSTCTAHSGATKAHWMVSVLGPLFRMAGHTVRTQHGVTASAGQRRGDVEIRSYLRDQAGSRSIVSTSCRMHGEFLRLIFLQAHRATEAHCSWNVIAKLPNGHVPFQARGFPPVIEEQDRPSSLQSGGVEDQPQYPGLWHSGSPSARSFSRSPSPPPPSFTQYPSPAFASA